MDANPMRRTSNPHGFVNIEMQLNIVFICIGIALLLPPVGETLQLVRETDVGFFSGVWSSIKTHWIPSLIGGLLVLVPVGTFVVHSVWSALAQDPESPSSPGAPKEPVNQPTDEPK